MNNWQKLVLIALLFVTFVFGLSYCIFGAEPPPKSLDTPPVPEAPYEPPSPEEEFYSKERPIVEVLSRLGRRLGVLAKCLEKCKQDFKKIKLQRKRYWFKSLRQKEVPTTVPHFIPKQDNAGPHCPN